MRASSSEPGQADGDAPAAIVSGAEETVAFVMSLRAKGVRDIRVLRAMEMVPRELFAPRRFSDLARADVSLPLACGQTMTAPGPIAAMLVALAVEPQHRVLEVGTGSGYVTAVLGRLGREVLSIERFRTLALSAAERVGSMGLSHVRIATGDGLAVARQFGAFDRILLNGTIKAAPAGLLAALAPGGRLVAALLGDGHARLLRLDRSGDGTLAETLGAGLRLPPLVPGAAAAL